jgi:hypothetical protein
LRLSVGIESGDDLVEDLVQAIDLAAAVDRGQPSVERTVDGASCESTAGAVS